jgi:pyruvate dehydrogenase E1 component
MGIGPITAIYQARFMRYLEDRGLKKRSNSKVWAFLGDGETDEPESLGAITLASREKARQPDFRHQLQPAAPRRPGARQRPDHPGTGRRVPRRRLERDQGDLGRRVGSAAREGHDGLLVKRMGEVVDGEYQKYAVESGDYVRKHFWGKYPQLLELVKHLSDEQLKKLTLGGHDPIKVYAAYKAAVEHTGQPTVILARTIKGYGIGESGEGKNSTHQQKKLNEDELRAFRARFGIPIADEEVAKAPFYRPSDNSPEVSYLLERRKQLGGFVPSRKPQSEPLKLDTLPDVFSAFHKGSEGRKASTTMAFVQMLTKLLKDPEIGQLVVPIVPDEARTFGMEALFRQVGIYSHVGQLYEPVDMDVVLYYKEAKEGQILEEGITEAGSISSFIAAGSAYATHGINTIPFFIYYSMFGMQRVGDFVWAAADTRRGASCSAAPPAARRSPVKGCSTRMATATCWRSPCRT